MKKLLLALAITGAMLLAASQNALAYNNWKTYGMFNVFAAGGYNGVCVDNKAEIGNGPVGGGALRGTGVSARANAIGTCAPSYGIVYVNVPPGWIAVIDQAFKWNGSSWAFCASTGYKYNTITASTLVVYSYQGIWTPPCNAGTYTVVTTTYVWNGSAWKGGGSGTPNMYLPSSTGNNAEIIGCDKDPDQLFCLSTPPAEIEPPTPVP